MKFNSTILRKAQNKVTVALSMGADSLAVLHFLKTRMPKIQLSAIHYNHNLRGQNFEMEGKAIRFCHKHQIPLVVKRRNRYTQKGTSEADLRTYRLKAFAESGGYIATGHHLDDACESYMMNCFKGQAEYMPIPTITEFDGFTVIRPFILTKKQDMLDYLTKHDLIDWIVEDETNVDQKYQRNWVRHSILPQVNSNGFNIYKTVGKIYRNRI